MRRAYAAYADAGVDGVLPFFAADHVTYSIPEWLDESEYHGHEGLQRLSQEWTDNFEQFYVEVHEVRDAGSSVVALIEMRGRTKTAGVPVAQPVGALHSRFERSCVGETRYFPSWAEALAAAGL